MATLPGVELRDKRDYYGYVYLWCDLKRDMFYIGSHRGSVYDSYKCSNVRCKRALKQRPQTFKFYLISLCNSETELSAEEERWLRFYSVAENKAFYNLKNSSRGGSGPPPYKGQTKLEYFGPGYVDPRKGKTKEEIYGADEAARLKRIASESNILYFQTHGYGRRKGVKNKNVDKRLGKSHIEIYGYVRHANPPKPFIVAVHEPHKDSYDLKFSSEGDFFIVTKLEESSLRTLKRMGKKVIKRRGINTKHLFPIDTVLLIKSFPAEP
jgi:hypothetical protein